MKQTLYMYAMTCDTNFAPCIQNQLLTLACCKGGKKGGMRKSAGELFLKNKEKQADEEIWLLGVCGKGLKNAAGLSGEDDYTPVFMAKITKVLSMIDYYRNSDEFHHRSDHAAYTVDQDGKLKAVEDIRENPHYGNQDAIEKDIGGQYVLFSAEFLYFGKNNRVEAMKFKNVLPDYFFDSTKGKRIGNKAGIDKHQRGYIIYDDFDCINTKWQEYFDIHKAKVTVEDEHLLKEFIPNEVDDESDTHRCSCAGGK